MCAGESSSSAEKKIMLIFTELYSKLYVKKYKQDLIKTAEYFIH